MVYSYYEEEFNSIEEIHGYLGMHSIPYDPFIAAKKLGIKLDESMDMEKINNSGSICIDEKGQHTIWINMFDSDARQRFTAAHELGHFFHKHLEKRQTTSMIDNSTTLYRRDSEYCPVEAEANRFAADFLMPENSIREKAKEILSIKAPTFDEFVSDMSLAFEVSSPAMKIRLKTLGLISNS